MLSRKADNPGVVQVSPGQPRSYDSFLLTGLATKRVLPGVRTSYGRGIGKLRVMSASGRLPTLPCRKTTVSRYRRQWDGNGAFARVKPVRETLSDSATGRKLCPRRFPTAEMAADDTTVDTGGELPRSRWKTRKFDTADAEIRPSGEFATGVTVWSTCSDLQTSAPQPANIYPLLRSTAPIAPHRRGQAPAGWRRPDAKPRAAPAARGRSGFL
jgi:hypothetical protein